jgi:uncharacterized hydrophobic protein (TIGR00271 family)
MFHWFNNFEEKDKTDAVEKLIEMGSPRREFFLFVVLAVLMATFGLLKNDSAIIIGSMLIAPVLYPILGISMGVVMSDVKFIKRGLVTLLQAVVFALFASALVGLFTFDFDITKISEIVSRSEINYIDSIIAFFAGFAASFALVKPQLNETLPGVAISVSLIPPLAVAGIGLSRLDFIMARNAFLVFAMNTVGTMIAAVLVFSLMNFYLKRKLAESEIKKDEAAIKKEAEKETKQKKSKK